jgi:hypothetical protein
MNGLGGLNKSEHGVVIGLVQLQLPITVTPADLARQTARVVELVANAAWPVNGHQPRHHVPDGRARSCGPEACLHGQCDLGLLFDHGA